jgi:putative hydrolase of the HAD superfamily
MSIKAIVFDFGNVVGYFSHRRTTERLAPHSHVPADKLHSMIFGTNLEDLYERGHISTAEFRAALKQEAALTCSDAYFDEAYADIFWPHEALCARLPELARRYTLVLLSNTNELHAVKFRVQFADALRHFRHLVLSHEVRGRKPEAAVYAHATACAGCAPEEVLFFDDLPANVEAGRAAGWNAVVFTGVEVLNGLVSA